MPTERELFHQLFVDRGPMRSSEFAREIMVLGLLNFYKWDDALAWEESHSGNPDGQAQVRSPEQLAQFQLTSQRVHDIEHDVGAALESYVEKMRPVHGFWYGVWQGIVSSFLYSPILAAVVIAILFGNVNIPQFLGIEIRAISDATTPSR